MLNIKGHKAKSLCGLTRLQKLPKLHVYNGILTTISQTISFKFLIL